MSQLFRGLLLSIGAMKAGTTWLYMALREHPQITVTPVKETSYFWHLYGDFSTLSYQDRLRTLEYNLPRILRYTEQGEARDLLRWFESYISDPVDDAWFAHLFPSRAEALYCADFSNLYSSLPMASWDHIKTLSNNIKILYTVRSPIDRLWSHTRFQAHILGRFDHVSDWTEDAFREFLLTQGVHSRGLYSKTLDMLKERFDKDDYMICIYEDIISRPAGLLADVRNFLGVQEQLMGVEALQMRHHASRVLDAPTSFYRAAVPLIEQELARLAERRFPTPPGWLRDLDGARARLRLA